MVGASSEPAVTAGGTGLGRVGAALPPPAPALPEGVQADMDRLSPAATAATATAFPRRRRFSSSSSRYRSSASHLGQVP